MGSQSKGITASFPIAERAAIEARVAELKLPAQGGLSIYFQMLRDYDVHFQLVPHYHKSDGKLHFYSEETTYPQAAEGPPVPAGESTSPATDAARRLLQAEVEARAKKPAGTR